MSFLSPFPLLLAGAVALGVVALHLLTTRRPLPAMLPTARFVPLAEARAVSRASRPTDLLLLALRVLAVLLIGAALARPVVDAAGPAVRTVVMLDVSRAVADPAAARAIAGEEIGEGGALVVFDSAAREMPSDSVADGTSSGSVERGTPLDSVERDARGPVGRLSPALVIARRAAARIARGADSVRLVLVSPLVEGSVDAATASLRALWPGRIDVRRVPAATDTARGEPATLVTPLDDDPLAPAVEAVGGLPGGHRVRIERGTTAPSGTEDVLIRWPATFEDSIAPAGVTAFDPAAIRSATVVAPLARLAIDTSAAGTRVIARWNDGAAAVVQAPAVVGCVRHIGIGVPLAGDLTLRAPFRRLLQVLMAPCDGLSGAPLPEEAVSWLASGQRSGGEAGEAPAAVASAPLASAAEIVASSPLTGESNRWPLILLVLATVVLAAELVARRWNRLRHDIDARSPA